ncbi:fungal-specific transcription factor domain-containing protein [Mycena belliarum]|uniref:Fungal-specific transcription factor domain-containing protein n=1 Tax=Mycena belliarum TaxID=1033014 RepID=A0AAD6TW13_9AGAR|nr:fungal-specific transcription factor domain-containing protein [Mycena belliae]
MSSDEECNPALPVKKRRVQRACDACRLKKSDGLRMSAKKCTACIDNGLDCTFAGAIAKRRSYVDVLEARLVLTEQMLRKLSPTGLDAAADSPSPGSSHWSSDGPIAKYNDILPPGTGPGVELAALTIRSLNTPAPAPHDDLEHIELTQNLHDLSLNHHQERFHGKSSGAMLVKAAVQLRERYEEKEMPWASRRMHYWTFNPMTKSLRPLSPYVFPAPDLLAALVDLYFLHTNLYYPLLHRPTFERALADDLHLRAPAFGAVVLVVCAIASRYSDDPRVSAEGAGEEPLRCGWQSFEQLPQVLDHLFEKPTLHHLQYYCLAVTFLEFSMPAPCWTLVGIGLRVAQDIGVHRAHRFASAAPEAGDDGANRTAPTVESELWKRAFWVIVCYDRTCSSAMGRACTTQYEDFDVELPIEVDDEYWESPDGDPAQAFVQPPGKPSRIAFFNCFIRLNNILAFTLKMLYSLNKARSLLAVRDEAWEEHIVAELDSALNGWVDQIPDHLRWDPNRRDDMFFDQSVYLYCHYYQVQMMIHRPFIPMIRKGASTALPSLAICTNAARSCSHVADTSNIRKNGVPVPGLVSGVFTAAVVLLLNVWSGKRTGLPPHMNSALTEVHKCMRSIQVCEKRWQSMGLFWDLLYELAAIGQFPLPGASASPPTPAPGSSTNAAQQQQPQAKHNANTHKRAREEFLTSAVRTTAVARYPPSGDRYEYPPAAPASTSTPASTALPTYTADLGRLPVFHPHPYAERSSWYPAQTSSAPLGYPDFTVGSAGVGVDPHGGTSTGDDLAFGAGYALPPDLDFGARARAADAEALGLSSDAMAMWANAPTGFEYVVDLPSVSMPCFFSLIGTAY